MIVSVLYDLSNQVKNVPSRLMGTDKPSITKNGDAAYAKCKKVPGRLCQSMWH